MSGLKHRLYTLLFWTVQSSTLKTVVEAQGFRPICKLPTLVVPLQYNSLSERYEEIISEEFPGAIPGETNNDGRRLKIDSTQQQLQVRGVDPLVATFDTDMWVTRGQGVEALALRDFRSNSHRLLQENDTLNKAMPRLYVRECRCRVIQPQKTFYCPLELTHCALPRWNSSLEVIPTCLSNPTERRVLKNTGMVILVWFSIITFCILFSGPGRSLFGFFLSFCIPGYNQRVVSRMIRKNPERAERFIRNNIRVRRTRLERRLRDAAPELLLERQAAAAGVNNERLATMVAALQQTEDVEKATRPTSLHLNTHLYQVKGTPDPSTDEEEFEHNCIICFSHLTEGDRVGLLKCNHVFHAACLKSWLKMGRNVCPLCQTPNIAIPQYSNGATRLDAGNHSDTQSETMPSSASGISGDADEA